MFIIVATITFTGIWLPLVLSALLFGVCWQDVRERKVSLLLLLVLIGASMLRFFLTEGALSFPLVNSLFLVLQGSVVMLYLLLRYRTLKIGNYLGAGDVLFWLACLWCFSPLNFLIFFIVSMLGALLLHLLLRRIVCGYEQVAIPLAGYQGLFLVLAFVMDALVPAWGTYNDFPLLTTLGLT